MNQSRPSTAKRTVASRRKGPRTRNTRKSNSSHGHRIDVGTNPPPVDYQPWYPLTLVSVAKASSTMLVKDITQLFLNQLDPESHAFIRTKDQSNDYTFRFQFKILNIKVWSLTGKSVALTVVDYSDISRNEKDHVCGLVDTGTSLHVAGIGFVFPINLQTVVLRNDAQTRDVELYRILIPGKDEHISYISILWRLDGPISAPSGFVSQMERLYESVSSIRRGVYSQAPVVRSIQTDTSAIAAQTRPSVIDTLINGIKKTAEVVAIAGAADMTDTVVDSISQLTQAVEQLRMTVSGKVSVISEASTYDELEDDEDESPS